jgi:tRNA A-37 threonylcarbamoyl transferase component Bud32/ribosomal protein L40E
MSATLEYVRVCPVCGAEAAADAAQCVQCGTLLLGVDLTLRQPPPEPAPTVSPPAAPAVAPQLRCPHADCGALNPPGSERCLYCDRPLTAEKVGPNTLLRLPAALADKFRIVEVLPAGGAEAEIMLLAGINSGVKVIAKLYRPGMLPKSEVLERVSRAAFGHVVHLIAHGESEGVGYEVMEYCAHGSLRDLMRSGPLPRDRLRAILAEIAAALTALHELHVIHRDLKPENVLVRRLEPLDLVLTDFGIASVNDATQRFTSLARSIKYGAPETLSGVLDQAADWWSLGMIVVELLTGHHPFDGLSDAVITHQLVTGRVDLAAVEDPAWRTLCRGLLLRDPQRRWGAAETRRWLDGDASLVAPVKEAPHAGLHAARPYRIEDAVCTTADELAVALASHWPAGRKDLMRGQLSAWIGQELRDDNLLRVVQDLLDARDLSDDLRLLRLIRRIAPAMPPVWRGESLAVASLLAQAARAEQGENGAADWLLSVFVQQVLRELPAAQFPVEAALVARWEAAHARFLDLWREIETARTHWRKEQTNRDGVADFDALVFGQPADHEAPPPARLQPLLLLALADEAYAARLLERVRAEAAPHLADNPWLDALLQAGASDGPDPVRLVIAWLLLPHARTAAEDAQKRRARERQAETAQVAALLLRANQALAMLRDCCELGLFAGAFERGVTASAAQALLALTEEVRAQGLAPDAPLLRTLQRAEPVVLRIQERLDAWDHAARVNAIWRNPRIAQGFAYGLVAFVVLTEMIPFKFLTIVPLALAAVVGWRFMGLAEIRGALRKLAKALPIRVPAGLPPTMGQ